MRICSDSACTEYRVLHTCRNSVFLQFISYVPSGFQQSPQCSAPLCSATALVSMIHVFYQNCSSANSTCALCLSSVGLLGLFVPVMWWAVSCYEALSLINTLSMFLIFRWYLVVEWLRCILSYLQPQCLWFFSSVLYPTEVEQTQNNLIILSLKTVYYGVVPKQKKQQEHKYPCLATVFLLQSSKNKTSCSLI